MKPQHLVEWARTPAMVSFGSAVLSVAVALGIAWWIEAVFHAAAPVSLFLCAVMFSAWVGGIGPGLVAIGLSVLSLWAFDSFFTIPSTSPLADQVRESPRLLLYLVSAIGVASLSAARRNAARSLARINDALQAENVERQGVEEELRQLLSLLDLTHDTISVRDLNDVITYWNRGAEELYGWTKEQAIGQVAHRLLRTVFPVPFEQIIAQLMRTGRWEGELKQERRDRTTVVVSTRWALQRGGSGDSIGVLVATNDITDRKQAEDTLRRSEAHLAEAQRLSHAGSWAIDPAKGQVIHASAELFRLWGLDQQGRVQSIGALRQRVHPDDRDRFVDALQRAILGQGDVEVEYRALLPEGTIRHMHTVAHPVSDASGDLIEIIGTSLDITDRKRAEDALREAQADVARVNRVATLGALVASIAHEVNQPLGAMVTSAASCSRWLAAQPPDLPRAQRALDRIVRDGHRASDVVAGIRTLVKRQLPRQDLVDLNEAVLEVLALVRDEAQRTRVSVKTRLAQGLPRVQGDRVQLQQVTLNLIMNAIEAMSAIGDRPRELVIGSWEDSSKGVVIAVRDSGRGLESTDTDQLFKAFHTTKPDGIGMGLAISRSLVEANGGRLWARSNVPHGAVFQFSVPCRTNLIEPRQRDSALRPDDGTDVPSAANSAPTR
jgi:PAS domain S-box-containing protein